MHGAILLDFSCNGEISIRQLSTIRCVLCTDLTLLPVVDVWLHSFSLELYTLFYRESIHKFMKETFVKNLKFEFLSHVDSCVRYGIFFPNSLVVLLLPCFFLWGITGATTFSLFKICFYIIRKQLNSSRHFMMPIWAWAIFTRYTILFIFDAGFRWKYLSDSVILCGQHCLLGCRNVSGCNYMLPECSTGMATKCSTLWWV